MHLIDCRIIPQLQVVTYFDKRVFHSATVRFDGIRGTSSPDPKIVMGLKGVFGRQEPRRWDAPSVLEPARTA
jgi:hypothetical protein